MPKDNDLTHAPKMHLNYDFSFRSNDNFKLILLILDPISSCVHVRNKTTDWLLRLQKNFCKQSSDAWFISVTRDASNRKPVNSNDYLIFYPVHGIKWRFTLSTVKHF